MYEVDQENREHALTKMTPDSEVIETLAHAQGLVCFRTVSLGRVEAPDPTRALARQRSPQTGAAFHPTGHAQPPP